MFLQPQASILHLLSFRPNFTNQLIGSTKSELQTYFSQVKNKEFPKDDFWKLQFIQI